MTALMKKWGIPVAAFFLTASFGYWIVLGQIPGFVMGKAWDRLAERSGVNTAGHVGAIDADNRTIVRPSPDLAYSVCPFDVSDGPLEIGFSPITDHYWSVTIFDAETNTAFVLNDKAAGESRINIDVRKADENSAETKPAGNLDTVGGKTNYSVKMPTEKGVALLRILVRDEEDFQEIDSQRRLFNCGPLVASPTL